MARLSTRTAWASFIAVLLWAIVATVSPWSDANGVTGTAGEHAAARVVAVTGGSAIESPSVIRGPACPNLQIAEHHGPPSHDGCKSLCAMNCCAASSPAFFHEPPATPAYRMPDAGVAAYAAAIEPFRGVPIPPPRLQS